MDVVIKNASKNGVRIEGGDMSWLPDHFEIQTREPNGVQRRRQVRRVWVRNTAAGLQFVESAGAA
jgi:hypothetical protein